METALPRRRRLIAPGCLLALIMLAVAPGLAQRDAPPGDLAATLARASGRVEEYFARAQSLVCIETVIIQPLNSSLTGDGVGRVVESELRLSWAPGENGEPSGEAQTRRQVIKVNGGRPRAKDHNNCTGPEQNETETQPLSMLLASQRDDYAFSWAGRGRVDKRDALMIDFREVTPLRVDVTAVANNEDCVSWTVTGGGRGRLWLDTESFDVLRLDQRLGGQVEVPLPKAVARRAGAVRVWTMERHDTSYRFKRVAFTAPDETIVLPVSSTSLRVTAGSGTPRLRVTTAYKNYQRFLTGGRLVPGDSAPP